MLRIIKQFFAGHKRTVKAKKNIVASLIINGLSIVVGFLMVRITLTYLDQTKYGIWLTVTSITAWIAFFEIGLGGGLKNRLAIAFAKKDYELGKTYVSTTYAILAIIITGVALLFFLGNSLIDWVDVLNTEEYFQQELNTLIIIVFGFFFLRFVLNLIVIVLIADQRPALANSFAPIGKFVSLILIYILIKITRETNGSLIYLGWILSAIPMIVLVAVSIYFYRNDYKKIAPSLKYVKFEYAKDLLNLGIKFFFIQISMLIIFQSSNIIIAHFYGPAEVTPYNIAHKLFSIIIMIFTIIASPFQVAFTEAWTIKDMAWVRRTVKNLFNIWLGLLFLAVFLYFISDIFFEIWIGKEKMKTIIISDRLKISQLIYFLLFALGGVFNMFINGVAKVSVQMYTHIIGAIIFIPVTYFFINYLHWGIESVVIGGIIANFYYPIIAPIQYYKIVTNKARGIWNK
jgi:O-antigen/teichoic acid export membrane protein